MTQGDKLHNIGLFSSNPMSPRAAELETTLKEIGANPQRIYPWMITQHFSDEGYSIEASAIDLFEVNLMYVLDVGALDIGSYLHRIGILSVFEEQGTTVVNSVKSIGVMRNKSETLRVLQKAGIRIPETLVTESIAQAAKFVQKKGECVIKPIIGFGGEGVQHIHEQFDLDNIYDLLKVHTQMFGKGALLLQEYIKSPGYDIRALVMDDAELASMQRVSRKGFLTNIHAGGRPRPNDIDVSNLAIEAAKAVGGRIVGVDLLPDEDGELWVLEVNATPGWSGLQSITDFSIARKIAESLVFGR
jgi:RimK family alpha-L-glutamate ligase